MSGFFWTSGHLGWGMFALVVFTALWVLAGDAWWRLKATRAGTLAVMLGGGWLVGAALIVLGCWICTR